MSALLSLAPPPAALHSSPLALTTTTTHASHHARLFHEVNYGPQADSLFKIPKLVMDQCTEKLEDVDIYDVADPVALLAQIPHY
jgi:hypothetical protein